MHPDSWQYLGVEWSGRYYVFRVLPFGLKPACWVFTMAMKCLARRWRTRGITLLQYLDDFLFFAPTAAAARAVRQWVLADFAAAGLLLSWPKCQLEPVQRLKHLGFVIDTSTMTFEAPADRWDRLHTAVRQALAAPHVSAKAIASIVGQLMSFGLAFGRLSYMYSRALDLAASSAPHWRARIQLPAVARAELAFWLTVPQSAYTSPIRRPPLRPAFRLCTDASDHAWGAVLLDTQASASDYLPAASLRSGGIICQPVKGVCCILCGVKALDMGQDAVEEIPGVIRGLGPFFSGKGSVTVVLDEDAKMVADATPKPRKQGRPIVAVFYFQSRARTLITNEAEIDENVESHPLLRTLCARYSPDG